MHIKPIICKDIDEKSMLYTEYILSDLIYTLKSQKYILTLKFHYIFITTFII